MRFVADDEDQSFEVSTDMGACSTPCELQLQPGATHVRVTGPKSFSKWIQVPLLPAVVTIKARSSVRTGLGIAGTVIGGAATAFSTVGLIGLSGETDTETNVASDLRSDPRLWIGGVAVGAAILVTSLIGGFATNLTGAEVELDERRADAPRPRLIGLSALPSGGVGMVLGAAFEF